MISILDQENALVAKYKKDIYSAQDAEYSSLLSDMTAYINSSLDAEAESFYKTFSKSQDGYFIQFGSQITTDNQTKISQLIAALQTILQTKHDAIVQSVGNQILGDLKGRLDNLSAINQKNLSAEKDSVSAQTKTMTAASITDFETVINQLLIKTF